MNINKSDIEYSKNLSSKERRNMILNDIKYNIIPGVVCSTLIIASNGLMKENKGDTFVDTMKNAAKYQAKSTRKNYSDFFKYIKMNKASKFLTGIGNKKFLAISFIGKTIVNTALCAVLFGTFGKKKEK